MTRFVLLFVLVLAAAPASAQRAEWANAEQVTVTLSNFEFAPETITLTHGRIYRLHLVNNASGGHNFVARDFFRHATVAPQDAAKLDDGTIELEGGESVDIRFVAPQAGEYDLHCSHFMHTVFGMTGDIVVR